ncbi:hypothetical protein HPB51_007898 [Rhipicephalus microplus]|uniref:Gamma-interferon inducible lysosomal thiol reductase n=1 Tax=Rhipicephalus microplus TaxID=6941 RepID=A0A9J6EMS3_RHIMP|nr:hypothetical protein HPB51_007898 [Rhipicephalus microplus]
MLWECRTTPPDSTSSKWERSLRSSLLADQQWAVQQAHEAAARYSLSSVFCKPICCQSSSSSPTTTSTHGSPSSAGSCEYRTTRSADLVAILPALTIIPEKATAVARPVIAVSGDRSTEERPDDRVGGGGVAVVMAPRLRDKGGVVRTSRFLLWLAVLSAVACCGRAMQGFVRRRRVDFSQIPKTARIQLYYESLCPYSVAFITEQLWPTYVRVGYLMDVQLVPFGNAFKEQQQEKPNSSRAERFAVGRRQEADYKYSCQHGPDECFGNVVQSCAAHIFNDTILSLAFVTCMSLAERPHEAGRECARGIARNWNAIQRCANGGKGRVLQDEMGERTWNLDPPHHYVPWLVINGVHNDEQQAMAQTDLLQGKVEYHRDWVYRSVCGEGLDYMDAPASISSRRQLKTSVNAPRDTTPTPQVVCDATPDGRKPPPCFADMEERRSLQKLSASVEEQVEDAPNGSLRRTRLSAAGHSLKKVQD